MASPLKLPASQKPLGALEGPGGSRFITIHLPNLPCVAAAMAGQQEVAGDLVTMARELEDVALHPADCLTLLVKLAASGLSSHECLIPHWQPMPAGLLRRPTQGQVQPLTRAGWSRLWQL